MNVGELYRRHISRLQSETESVLSRHGFDALVLASGTAAAKNRFDDAYWPLSPTPAYLHWVPRVEPDAYLVVRQGVKPRLVRTRSTDFWEAPPTGQSEHYRAEIDEVSVVAESVRRELPSGEKVAVICRDDACAVRGQLNPAAVVADLDAIRTRKSEYELYCLEQATVAAAKGHRRVAELFANGEPSELQLHLAYLSASDQDDSDAPYKGIVAQGEHAAVLHWVSYERAPNRQANTSLLVDAGAKHWGYGSDITRTYARGSSPAARRFASCIQRMERLQRDVCERIAVGTEYEDLHDQTHMLLAVALVELGIGKGTPEALVETGVTRALFPHGLGHSLGIVTHDVGMKLRAPRSNNPFLRNTSRIEAGQVFTIEPGLYFIGALLGPVRSGPHKDLLDWAVVEELTPFGGIRIEDNLAVNADGVINLTRRALG